ncbi:MAG: hypothetical protein A3G41_05840 [Elusimicrobia bacterium RIFCSPLOWO2_12_FULL_59_9]|nr:MAG: hypothetical protein A3G41_05840 [Elusimicrobia bacterium RIFCSPLOWO2_12_FULL_59_9]
MANWPDNKNKHWTPAQVRELKQLAGQNTPTRVIGLKTGRTPAAVQAKASDVGLSLKPTNQRPYGKAK